MSELIPQEAIESRILLLRSQKVMIDYNLASLYGLPTKRLNEQVKRNQERFPEDFMFQLTEKEKAEVVANCDHLSKLRFSPVLPYAFTEHGAIMAANVLNSPKAIKMSVLVVRTFIRLRQLLASHSELRRKVEGVEKKALQHDRQFVDVYRAISQLQKTQKEPPLSESKPKGKLGFGY